MISSQVTRSQKLEGNMKFNFKMLMQSFYLAKMYKTKYSHRRINFIFCMFPTSFSPLIYDFLPNIFEHLGVTLMSFMSRLPLDRQIIKFRVHKLQIFPRAC